MSNEVDKFKEECIREITAQGADKSLADISMLWRQKAREFKYGYHFSWLDRPIIQYPQDIIAIQELIWSTKPDLIIETGIAHGGSLILSASMLAILDYCEAVEVGATLNPFKTRRHVLGIDIDIRSHNLAAIEAHPMSHLIEMIQGSSISPEVVERVKEKAKNFKRVLVCLDSNHTYEHVLNELEVYAPLTGIGSYCVVFDTSIEDMPDDAFSDRPWGKGNNPKIAVREYLRRLEEEGRTASDGSPLHFEIDKLIENKLIITVAPEGYLKRVD
ncbi:MAG: Rhamnosyl O-methyltransferase precursor [Syntrophus sp. PtaB.Bin001]|nr:MAG: Rhamnosyl O-methyltransferase precursor [Syntrophus sp. PtaB.Bin001]